MSITHPAEAKKRIFEVQELEIEIIESPSGSLIDKRDNPTQKSITNRNYFLLLLFFFGTDSILSANITITLPSMLSTFANSEFLDIPQQDIQNFNFYFVNAVILGNMLGGILNSMIAGKLKLSYLRLGLKLLFLLSIATMLIHERTTVLIARGIQGFCLAVLEPNNFAELVKLSPKTVRGTIGNLFSFYFAIGVMIGEFLYYLSKKDLLSVKWIYLILCLIELFSILLSFFYLGVDLSYTEYLERGRGDGVFGDGQEGKDEARPCTESLFKGILLGHLDLLL